MRNRVVWLAGALGAAGMAYRALRNRSAPTAESVADPRADELRRKLDEAKPIVEERAEFEAHETSIDQAEPSPDEKRAAVHAQGRAAADEMRRGSIEKQ
jgi:hypothetical protein